MSQKLVIPEYEDSGRVLTGTYDPLKSQIITDDGNTIVQSWSYRAMWSWLRLHMGKSKADWVIKSFKEEKKEEKPNISNLELQALTGEFMRELMRERNSDREVQYILDESDVKAVASTNHLLTSPEEIINSAQRVLPKDLRYDPDYGALISDLEDLNVFRINFQLDPGNIFTRRAIRVGFGLRITDCSNPLSWINAGGNEKFFHNPWTRYGHTRSRVLRIERKDSIDDRILEAYNESLEQKDQLINDVDNAKETRITDDEAKILGVAFPLSYKASQSTVKQILDRYYSEKTTGTLWGLAMAVSYVAKHGDRRPNANKYTRNLAGAGAGYLWINDKKAVVERAKTWLSETKKIDLEEWL